jgi:hypothetical protein
VAGEDRDELALIDADGVVRPIGQAAADRLQARQGTYRVMGAPTPILLLRRIDESHRAPPRRCILAGEITAAGALCDVVTFVTQGAHTGELTVSERSVVRTLYFEEGRLTFATSTADPERLGRVLHDYGALTADEVTACATHAALGSLRFGEAAVELGYLTRERLFELTGKQIEAIFYGALLAEEGTFAFLEGFDEDALPVRHRIAVLPLVREAVRRMHEAKFFRTRVPSAGHVPVRTVSVAPPDLDPLGVLPLADGTRSVEELARALGVSEFEATRAAYLLVQQGLVAIKPPRVDVPAAVAAFNEAMALLLRELDAMDRGDDLRRQLAAYVARSGVYEALFRGAGPTDDGRLDAFALTRNIASAADPRDAEQSLAHLLYEYVSFALFLARPHVERSVERPLSPNRKALPPREASARPRLSQRVMSLLEPLAPEAAPQPPAGTP